MKPPDELSKDGGRSKTEAPGFGAELGELARAEPYLDTGMETGMVGNASFDRHLREENTMICQTPTISFCNVRATNCC